MSPVSCSSDRPSGGTGCQTPKLPAWKTFARTATMGLGLGAGRSCRPPLAGRLPNSIRDPAVQVFAAIGDTSAGLDERRSIAGQAEPFEGALGKTQKVCGLPLVKQGGH